MRRISGDGGANRAARFYRSIQFRVKSDRLLDNYNVRIPDLAVTSEPVSPADRLLHAPLLIVEILSPSDWRRTWSNVSLYTTIANVREILVLHTAKVRAVLLRREADGSWPARPVALPLGDDVTLESIGFNAPLAAFYRTAGAA